MLPERIVERACWSITCSAPKPAGNCARAAASVPQRIVLVTPAMRTELAALKEAGFTGYLIKPVRAASLAARLSTNDGFESGGVERQVPSRRARPMPAADFRFLWPRTTISTRYWRARC